MTPLASTPSVAQLRGVGLRYRNKQALLNIDLDIPAGCVVGLIGPDGVGKSSLLSLLAGARALQTGSLQVLGGDMRKTRHRQTVCPRIAYMPQGLGKNLYPTLSIEENLQFFARLFGHDQHERRQRIDRLTHATGLHPFLDRPVGKLSGGMKQKLGLCCALIHDPDLLILDEPTTGVDPLARAQFWELIADIRSHHPRMSVIVATSYMDEAQRFDWLVAMDDGAVLAQGSPGDLLSQTGQPNLDAAFIALLPHDKRSGHRLVTVPPLHLERQAEIAIEAEGLTKRFDGFTAVDEVSFRIHRGEIFGFVGSNGCGKSTTMKMLTGLLPATEGQARLFGHTVDPHDMATRRRVGYMSQSFSLYSELSVEQNLVLHARLFHVAADQIAGRVAEMMTRFGLVEARDAMPDQLPLGLRQRLSLAVAMVHRPELLILDEPTSGVDPIARDQFWELMIDLARRDQVTIFISTHFMNEAERCDRVSLMHAGQVLESDTPQALIQKKNAATLEEAFIRVLADAGGMPAPAMAEHMRLPKSSAPTPETPSPRPTRPARLRLSLGRIYSYQWCEGLELKRDPVRGAMALLGSILLMFVMGYGISMDVENLRFAVLDRDQTPLSHAYTDNLAGSRYFSPHAPLNSYEELDRRMRSGELSLALEIPPGFARDVARGQPVQIGAWVDGAMPQRAETVMGFVQGMHQQWYLDQLKHRIGQTPTALAEIEPRYRYNPDVRSLPAMVPAVIPLLLLMLPSMLTALAVVREKELGSIINLYVTPTTRSEFLLGKMIPYVGLAMVNFLLMVGLAVTVFGVPITGSFLTLALGALVFCLSSTAMGLLASTVTKSQIAAMFFTMVGTMLPAVQFAGLINPVTSLQGSGRWIGEIYPATHMFTISRGIFSKSLGFGDLHASFVPLLLAAPVIFVAAVLLLKKQET